jgi:hypothetical protein
MMMKNMNRSFAVIMCRLGLRILLPLVVAVAVQPALLASETNTGCSVEYVDGRLTVEADKVSLGLLLAQIREKTGVEFVLSGEQSEKTVSVRLGPLPLAEGLEKMLSHFNHALLLGPSNEPVKVFILGYATAGRPSEYQGGTGALGGHTPISPSVAKTEEMKPAPALPPGPADINQTSGKSTPPEPLTEKVDTKPPHTEEMPITPSSEIMVIHPATGGEMVVTPSSETMVIRPAPADQMVITPPTPETNSLIENMMKGIKDTSKPK